MPKAQCYYEILGIDQTASSDEVKRAYKNAALVWHPDKNQSNPDEAHTKFQSILKAYETLSDSKERDWYDRHKDQILTDGENIEAGINLFQYFSNSCYANYDDSDDGFYTVYKKVFDTIISEEQQAYDQIKNLGKKNRQTIGDDPSTYPTFGNSNSDYDEVVRPFYAFWTGFCTYITFDHLDKWNTTEAENRRMLRAMEKENKKAKDQARKEKNNNVRNLVEILKKRDKRLKAHKLMVEQQIQINRQKTAEMQRQQREKSIKESSAYKPTAWEDENDIEAQLQQLEIDYELEGKKRKRTRQIDTGCSEQNTSNSNEPADGVGFDTVKEDEACDGNRNDDVDDDEDNDGSSDDGEVTNFFCPACNKEFRSMKAFENHEGSKKHKQNVVHLRKVLKNDEKSLNK